jgi:hypothetical protein
MRYVISSKYPKTLKNLNIIWEYVFFFSKNGEGLYKKKHFKRRGVLVVSTKPEKIWTDVI